MKRILLFFCLSFCTILMSAQDNNSTLVGKIKEASTKITSLTCDFVQKKQVSILNESLISSGQLFFSQGGKLCWQYIKPYAYSFVMNGSKIALRSDGSTNVFDTKSNKMFSQISKLIMCGVDGSGIDDVKNFDITLKEESKDVVVTMLPKARDVKKMFSKIMLHFGKDDYYVKKIELFEPSGDKTEIEILNRKTNCTIDEKVFVVE